MSNTLMDSRTILLCVAVFLTGASGDAFAQAQIGTKQISTAEVAAKLLQPVPGVCTKTTLDNSLPKEEIGAIQPNTAITVSSDSADVPVTTSCGVPVTLKAVPATTPVAFCVSTKVYDRATGKCGDGQYPYKIVPLAGISDPESKYPTIACTAPKVPTYSNATKKFSCLVPPGVKLSM